MIYQQTGMMIRQTNYSETSRIITILTESGEQVPLMARGFNKPKSPFTVLRQGFLEALFTYNRFKGMGTLNDVDVTERYTNLNSNFELYTHGSYILEVISRALDENYAESAYYNLLRKAYDLLDDNNERYSVTSLVLIKMLPAYGGELNVDSCAICGESNYQNYSHYSFKYHSVICNRCLSEESLERAVAISNKVLYFSLYLKHVKIRDVKSIHISEDIGKQLLRFIEMLYDEYSGVYFKSKKLIDK
ncbi:MULTISPECIES: DNA repair protein RecO [Jeotgalicoccus]|uniref:DNA repair protein RecO n=1 Tax=Jeotgalicoccus TaxID=227979 RepID=UPI0003F56E95|nr:MULTISPECIES: DNA repair protein RecO [Jeotgalicoccus]QQD85508.1 DNA repair protein RecO [Jeotgalicoccus sp. ATCC 8456]